MPIDAPDFTMWLQGVEIVGSTPTPETSSSETPISQVNLVTTTSQTYQTLISYTVTTGAICVLYGIEFYADAFEKGLFQLTIGGTQKWTDIRLPTALNIHFADCRLAAETVVLLEGKSSDGTSVDLWGSIEGKEVA